MIENYGDLQKKNLILYGISKFQQDFELFFIDLKISAYIDNILGKNTFQDKPVYTGIQDLAIVEKKQVVVVCEFYNDARRKYFEQAGLVYCEHFLFVSDVFKFVDDEIQTHQKIDKNAFAGKKIVVMGTGAYLNYLLHDFPDLNIEYFVDNNPQKWDTELRNKIIKPVEYIEGENNFILIVALSAVVEAEEQLNQLGLIKDKDYIFYRKIKYMPSELLTKTFLDKKRTSYVCDLPYTFAIIEAGGDVFNCRCSAWISLPVGNMVTQTYDEIINSVSARIFRLSVLNGTYSFCDERQCFLLKNAIDNRVVNTGTGFNYSVTTEKYPFIVAPTYDISCNLACKSCRKEFIVENKNRQKTVEKIHKNFITSLLSKTDKLFLAGNGEVFFSKYYLDLLEKYRGSRLSIQTNGILFTEDLWNKKIKGRFQEVTFLASIDAANSDTYHKVRGGNFNLLMKNLKFVNKLKKNGEIKDFILNFVVQKENFREVPDFVKLGIEVGADNIYFCKFMNFGILTDEEFHELDIFNPGHELYPAVMETLKDPILLDSRVNIGNLLIV